MTTSGSKTHRFPLADKDSRDTSPAEVLHEALRLLEDGVYYDEASMHPTGALVLFVEDREEEDGTIPLRHVWIRGGSPFATNLSTASHLERLKQSLIAETLHI